MNSTRVFKTRGHDPFSTKRLPSCQAKASFVPYRRTLFLVHLSASNLLADYTTNVDEELQIVANSSNKIRSPYYH